ncbi:MAG: inosine monophosphate cyclohydrolase [Ruminococcaceae bacterium]|nr:inosine monophosphate cyclohydrolase [Oscillospiraceae bacterium]
MNIYKVNDIGELIKDNEYVGRGIVIGKSEDGKKAVTAYFIMGRSENSRNRILIKNGDDIVINAYDPSKLEDPSLIIYSPVRVIDNKLIVTNGDQTDTVYDFIKDGKTFEEALDTRCFEPDGPNFTPRISGIMTFAGNDFTYKMSILKSLDEVGSDCARFTFSYPAKAGLGHFIHTYVCDGNPIPTFQGEPERVIVPNDIDEFTNVIWNNLNENNKISLYVRYVDLESGKYEARMINKNEGAVK